MARTVKNTKQQWQKEGEFSVRRNDWEVMIHFKGLVEKGWLKGLVEKGWLKRFKSLKDISFNFSGEAGESWRTQRFKN